MPIRVEGCGPKSARLVAIAEAPADHEVRLGQPLVGPSGWRLKEWWSRPTVNLRREDMRLENVYEYQAPYNKLDNVTRDELEPWMAYLHERIAALDDPWLIVAMGNYALYTLLNKGNVSWHTNDGKNTRPGITSWRGSILEYTDLNGRKIKLIPTPHPAATFRDASLERACIKDWERIAQEVKFRERNLPVREHFTSPSLPDLEQYYEQVKAMGDDGVLVTDIERPKHKVDDKWSYIGAPIVCVGYSVDPAFSITVPTVESYWGSEERLAKAWTWLRKLNALPIAKGLQNGLYDTFHLAEYAAPLTNWIWDSLYMHHSYDPSDTHSLAYQTSIFTREVYYKNDTKDPDEAAKYMSNWEAYLVYCGKDVCVTHELIGIHYQKLIDEKRLEWYFEHYVTLMEPLLNIMLHGVRMDDKLRRKRLTELTADCIGIQDRLHELTGLQLYGKKALSSKKLQDYFYNVLKLPVQFAKRTKGEKTESADEVAVRKLLLRYPEQLKDTGPLILDHRRKSVLQSFYKKERIDPDGRIRASYSPNTEAGRLSSSKNPRGTGANLQNQDREIRDVFLPDDGCVFVEVDLSQAEGRVCFALIYALTGDEQLLEMARARPDEFDQHTSNAEVIFNLPQHKITKDQRYLGKRAVHASQRGMHGKKLAEVLLKDGYVRTIGECQDMIDAYLRRYPGLQDYFRWVRRLMLTQHYLEDSWGGRLSFEYDRMNDDAFRRGYSFRLQSEIGRLMNQWGLKVLDKHIAGSELIHVNVHNHDSLLISTPPEYAFEVADVLVSSLERHRLYEGVELSIPCEIKIGTTWAMSKDFKRMPDRATFDQAVRSLC